MDDCLFCKIVKGDIPCKKIYEDDFVIAFLDISPKVKGHTLVIPKKHCTNIIDADSETLQVVMQACDKIIKHYINDIGFDSARLQVNNGVGAGQEVPHLHFHIMPYGDNVKETDLSKLQELLKMC